MSPGIIVGKMILELGDTSMVTNHQTGYNCDMEFKTKVSTDNPSYMTRTLLLLRTFLGIAFKQGWISGGYNAVSGHVKGPKGATVGDVSGHWDTSMEFKDKSGPKQTLFNVATAKVVPKTVIPEDEQEPNESRR